MCCTWILRQDLHHLEPRGSSVPQGLLSGLYIPLPGSCQMSCSSQFHIISHLLDTEVSPCRSQAYAGSAAGDHRVSRQDCAAVGHPLHQGQDHGHAHLPQEVGAPFNCHCHEKCWAPCNAGIFECSAALDLRIGQGITGIPCLPRQPHYINLIGNKGWQVRARCGCFDCRGIACDAWALFRCCQRAILEPASMFCRLAAVSLLRMAYAPSSACAVSEEVDNSASACARPDLWNTFCTQSDLSATVP